VTQSEYATDVMFAEARQLAQLYPQFLHHGVKSFCSPDVLRFLGKDVQTRTGAINGHFKGQVTTSYKARPEGVRLRHSVKGNSIKVYDKQGSILRVETTIVHPEEFKVYRPKEGEMDGAKDWRPLRRGVADLWRRSEVSRSANRRYLEALASVSGSSALWQEALALCHPVTVEGHRYRALNPLSSADGALLEAISHGEFALNGFRNRDLCKLLYPATSNQDTRRRRSAAMSRKLALLRAHGVIKKVPRTHRYLLTSHGRRILTAVLSARNADVDQLTKMAA